MDRELKSINEKKLICEFIYNNSCTFSFFKKLNESNTLYNYKVHEPYLDYEIDALCFLNPVNNIKKLLIIFEVKDMSNILFNKEKQIREIEFENAFKMNLRKYSNSISNNEYRIYGFLIFYNDINKKFNFVLFSLKKNCCRKISEKNYIKFKPNAKEGKYVLDTHPKETFDENLRNIRDPSFYLKCFDFKEKPLPKNEIEILNNIISKNNLICINGFAGTRKTAISFYLFGQLEKSSYLLLNKNLYKYFHSNIYNFNFENRHKSIKKFHYFDFHTEQFKSGLSDRKYEYDYLIIDEYQRCNGETIELIKDLLHHNKKVILLGDKYQAINKDSDILNISDVLMSISGNNLVHHKLKLSYRVDEKFIKFILFLIGIKLERINISSNIFPKIEITNDYDLFVKKIKEENKKTISCMATIQCLDWIKNGFYELEKRGFILANKTEPKKRENFLDDTNIRNRYCFFPYDLISREVDSIYVFIPKDLNYDQVNNKFSFKGYFKDKEIFIKNQLYVLLTRATKKVVLLVENPKLFRLFKERIGGEDV